MQSDFLIIGSGMAGMSAAYRLSKYGKVTVLEKEAYLAIILLADLLLFLLKIMETK